MRAGPRKAGVPTRVPTRARTELRDGGQATAGVQLRALSPSGPGFGTQEERKPFVVHHLEALRPAELVAHSPVRQKTAERVQKQKAAIGKEGEASCSTRRDKTRPYPYRMFPLL